MINWLTYEKRAHFPSHEVPALRFAIIDTAGRRIQTLQSGTERIGAEEVRDQIQRDHPELGPLYVRPTNIRN